MSNKGNIKRRMRSARRILEKRDLIWSAKIASSNAKRTSIALNLPFDIIKEGGVYKVYDGSMIKTASLIKSKIDIRGLSKGSILCLK